MWWKKSFEDNKNSNFDEVRTLWSWRWRPMECNKQEAKARVSVSIFYHVFITELFSFLWCRTFSILHSSHILPVIYCVFTASCTLYLYLICCFTLRKEKHSINVKWTQKWSWRSYFNIYSYSCWYLFFSQAILGHWMLENFKAHGSWNSPSTQPVKADSHPPRAAVPSQVSAF